MNVGAVTLNGRIFELTQFSALWAEHIWRAAWQGGLVILAVYVLTRLWRTMPPGARVWLWRVAYLKLLIAVIWVNPIELPLRPAPVYAAAPAAVASQDMRGIWNTLDVLLYRLAGSSSSSSSAGPLTIEEPPTGHEIGTTAASSRGKAEFYLLFAVLLLPVMGVLPMLGSMIGLAGTAVAWRRTGRLRARCRPLDDPAIHDLLGEIAGRLGLRQLPEVATCEDMGPLLLGTRKPMIVLPAAFLEQSNRGDLRLMLFHEMTHIARRDLWWAWLPTVARILFFFHPLVWLAEREWRLAQEVACDAQAVRAGEAAPADYGEMLLRFASWKGASVRRQPATIGLVESAQAVRRRLTILLALRTFSRRKLALIGLALGLLGAAALGSWRVTAQTPSRSSRSPEEEWRAEIALVGAEFFEIEKLKQEGEYQRILELAPALTRRSDVPALRVVAYCRIAGCLRKLGRDVAQRDSADRDVLAVAVSTAREYPKAPWLISVALWAMPEASRISKPTPDDLLKAQFLVDAVTRSADSDPVYGAIILADAKVRLAGMYRRCGKLPEALRACEEVRRMGDSNRIDASRVADADLEAAKTLLDSGRLEEAQGLLRGIVNSSFAVGSTRTDAKALMKEHGSR